MSGLNPKQEEAVRAVHGRLLVLAGAGSGKTRVIVHRIAHLIQDLGISPKAILGLTFTNKAAEEMRERVKRLIDPHQAQEVTLSTFHSFCMQVLCRHVDRLGYTKNFTLYDEKDLQRLMTQLSREILHCEEIPSLTPTIALLQEVSNRGLSPQESEAIAWPDSFSKELYHRLQGMLRSYNAVSFDLLLSLCLRLFTEHPDVLHLYQERYRYLMIDEYQDTNHAQFRLAELLASKSQNLCVVGDDDQSIYGWRGAEVSHILRFRADTTVWLEQNYRSTPSILEAANHLIQHNKERHPKKLWSSETHSEPIEIFHTQNDLQEAQEVVGRILELVQTRGLRLKDIAILYRSNALSRQFELALLQAPWKKEGQWVRGVPYEIFGGLEFSARAEIKDLLAYLRVLSNPLDQEALLRILNVPRRGISDLVVEELVQKSREGGTSLWTLLQQIATGQKSLSNHPRAVKGIGTFIDLLESAARRFATPPLVETLKWFIDTVNYKKAIEEEVKSDKARLFKWENTQEFVNSLAQYEATTPEAERSLSHFTTETLLFYQPSHVKKSDTDRVQLMTFHSAKGLEFPACFLIALEDRILPHERSVGTAGIEEERRLLYVGLTRARKYLTLSMSRTRMQMGTIQNTTPSRFLLEIPKTLLKLTPLRHAFQSVYPK